MTPLCIVAVDILLASSVLAGGHGATSHDSERTDTVPGGGDDRHVSPGILSELSYDAAVRALDLQERAVEQLRARTGTLLAASSLTASFLGVQSD